MRVLICGGRNAGPDVLISVHQWIAANCSPGDVVIHGAAPGVDTEAMLAAQAITGVGELSFPADWQAFGRAAGPIRNKRMLVEGCPDLVVAFSGGRGTANMIKQAHSVGIEVLDKQ